MKFVTLLILALAFATSSKAASVGVIGWALDENGHQCTSLCTAFAQDTTDNVLKSGAVGPNAYSCSGTTYNWGTIINPGSCTNPNGDGFKFTLQQFSMDMVAWVRRACPTGGYMFSPTHSINGLTAGQTWAAGTFRVVKPAGGCQAFAMPIPMRSTEEER